MARTLVDSIRAARQLFKDNPCLLTERVEAHVLFNGATTHASCGIRIRKDASGKASMEQAVATVAAAAAQKDSYPITIDLVPATVIDSVRSDDGAAKRADQLLRAILVRFETNACIVLVDGLNQCWTRFSLCKELCHIVLGQAHSLETLDIQAQLHAAITIARDPSRDRELSSEELGWFTAIEVMLPAQDRPTILERRASGEDSLSIAQSYHVPKAIVDLMFEGRYLEFCETV